MKHLIINADDFGYSRGANYAIVDSHRHGVLTSTTIMPAMPGFEHAVELAKENPDLGIGIHLTLTCGYPLLEGHKTLVKENGEFPRLGFYEDPDTEISIDEVHREWEAQIQRVLNAGIKPTHLDSHHHIHTYKGLGPLFIELAQKYDLPVRNSAPVRPEIDMADRQHPACLVDPIGPSGVDFSMSPEVYRDGMLAGVTRRLHELFAEHDVVEIMAHPAYVDFPILTGSSFNTPRAAETELLMSREAREVIEGLDDVSLASFAVFHK